LPGGGRAVSWPEFSPLALLRTLVGHGVDFVVIGGIALVIHGSTRVTQDLDICFADDQANLDVLGAALIDLDAKLRDVEGVSEFVPDGSALRRLTTVTLDTSQGPIDLLRDPIGAPPYEELRARAHRVDVDGIAVLVASLDDLVAMKRAAGRAKDGLDLEEINVIRRLQDMRR
jgi:predicted nucleotidyltransferase